MSKKSFKRHSEAVFLPFNQYSESKHWGVLVQKHINHIRINISWKLFEGDILQLHPFQMFWGAENSFQAACEIRNVSFFYFSVTKPEHELAE